jgi:hypothetical protein
MHIGAAWRFVDRAHHEAEEIEISDALSPLIDSIAPWIMLVASPV